MSEILSNDPRAKRTRLAFQNAFKDLLQKKSYRKITVKDIAEKAGYARHTFYNHYETKNDVLNQLIDAVLDEVFLRLRNWNFSLVEPEEESRMYAAFFQVWRDNPDIVKILNKIDVDILLIERLKAFFTRFYYERVTQEIPSANPELAKYMIHFNAYTLLGILKPWLLDGMKYPPEEMAGFLEMLAGSSQRLLAVEKYKNIIR